MEVRNSQAGSDFNNQTIEDLYFNKNTEGDSEPNRTDQNGDSVSVHTDTLDELSLGQTRQSSEGQDKRTSKTLQAWSIGVKQNYDSVNNQIKEDQEQEKGVKRSTTGRKGKLDKKTGEGFYKY